MLSAILSVLSFLAPVGKYLKANMKTVVPVILIAAVAIAYYWHDSRQISRIEQLEVNNQALSDTLRSERTLAAALKDTLRDIAENKPLPETIRVDYPVPGPDDTGASDTLCSDAGRPYVSFSDRQHWESWFRQHCTGMIAIDTSAIWENGQGAKVEGELYYGEGVDVAQYSWVLITPVGNIPQVSASKNYPRRMAGLMYGTDKEFAGIMSLAYWRGWAPAFGIGLNLNDRKSSFRIGILKIW